VIEEEIAGRLQSDLKCLLASVLRSVARRLVKTENPSACATRNLQCVNQR
jgi:hypothetical protein